MAEPPFCRVWLQALAGVTGTSGRFAAHRGGLASRCVHTLAGKHMKSLSTLLFTTLAVAGAVSSAAAASDPLSDCVSLSDGHRGTRGGRGGDTQLLLKDGDHHYRVAFNGRCDAIAMSSKVYVRSDGQINRLCPNGTTVESGRRQCHAKSVDVIDEATYERARRGRR